MRIQTSPVGTFPTTLRGAVPKIYAAEGMNGFYKSLPPLWGRQIPYTMMKFACFERTVELLYQYVVPKPRSECSKGEQLVVTFAAGYIAGGNKSFSTDDGNRIEVDYLSPITEILMLILLIIPYSILCNCIASC